MRSIDLIVVHCTASRCNARLTPEALELEHRARGFQGCGYHYYITTDGEVHPMRPVEKPGAHARGFNAHSLGIAYEGGLTATGEPADTRTAAQRAALRQLLARLLGLFPGARIVGHRDLSPDKNGNGIIEPAEYIKLCPCFNAIPEYAALAKECNRPLPPPTAATGDYPAPERGAAVPLAPNQSPHIMKKVWKGLLCVVRFLFTNETFLGFMRRILGKQ